MENFIESLGFEPILSEKGSIAYNPDIALDESCYKEAQNSDIFVIIIGGRYGSPTSNSEEIKRDEFYARYESVTKMEYESAVKKDIPIYILIDKSVKAEYETFKKNRENETIKYAHVDSINIFHFIESIFRQVRNNPVKEFDKHNDIEEWLKIQWAGLFRELIRTRSNQSELASLTRQVTELSNLNTTLKRYLEELITDEKTNKGKDLIKEEEERLKDVRLKQKLLGTNTILDMTRSKKMTVEDVIELFTKSKSLRSMARKYAKINGEEDDGERLYKHWNTSNTVKEMFKEVCDILGIPEIK